MCKKAKNKKVNLNRDFNIVKCAKGELNLGTRSVQDKTKYSRKDKHRKSFID